MDIKRGDWVVDNMGEYCQVTRIVHDHKYPEDDQIYGLWLNITRGEWKPSEALFSHRYTIVGSYPTKEVAQIHASVQNSIYESNKV